MLTLPVVSGVQKFRALRGDGAAGVSTAAFTSVEGRSPELSQPPRAAFAASGTVATDGGAASPVLRVLPLARIEPLLPALILTWIAGVSVLSLRLLTGWIWIQRLRTRGNVPAADELRRMAARLARRLHIGRAITLLESTLVDVPTVIGWLKPA